MNRKFNKIFFITLCTAFAGFLIIGQTGLVSQIVVNVPVDVNISFAFPSTDEVTVKYAYVNPILAKNINAINIPNISFLSFIHTPIFIIKLYIIYLLFTSRKEIFIY